ncbi:MAG: LolA-related protein [Pseudomonadota bacterium]
MHNPQKKRTWSTAVSGICLALLCNTSFANDWTVDRLMGELAQIKSVKASFVEKKYLAILDKPVESSGELFYNAPDRLEKRTLKPKPELMQLDRDTLVLERGRNKYTIQMQESPELAALIDSIRGTLAGDRKALERNYAIALEGTRERWVLSLTPTNFKASQAVKRIRLSGAKDEVIEIEVLQGDGDRSVTTVEKMKS